MHEKFYKKAECEERTPAETDADLFYSESNVRYLKNMERDIQEGKAKFMEHDLIETGNIFQETLAKSG